MTMIATAIPLRHLRLVWSDLWPLLEPAVKRSPDKPDVLARLLFNDAQLWAIYDADVPVAAIVTQVQVGTEKRCLIWLVGGSRLREWAGDFIAKLEDWARSLGGGGGRRGCAGGGGRGGGAAWDAWRWRASAGRAGRGS